MYCKAGTEANGAMTETKLDARLTYWSCFRPDRGARSAILLPGISREAKATQCSRPAKLVMPEKGAETVDTVDTSAAVRGSCDSRLAKTCRRTAASSFLSLKTETGALVAAGFSAGLGADSAALIGTEANSNTEAQRRGKIARLLMEIGPHHDQLWNQRKRFSGRSLLRIFPRPDTGPPTDPRSSPE